MEEAYAHVRRQALRQSIMITGSADVVSGAVLATKGLKLASSVQPPTVHNGRPKSRTSSEGLKCSHCGNSKNTCDTYFKIHGYSNWWNDLRAKKGRDVGTRMKALLQQLWRGYYRTSTLIHTTYDNAELR